MVKFSRRRFPPRRTMLRRRGPAKANSLATKAYRLAKKVASKQDVEYKYIEPALVGITPTSTVPYLWKITNSVAQGTARNQRIGNSILMKSLQIRGSVKIPNGSSTGRLTLRAIVYIDKEPRPGVAGSTSDIVVGGADPIALSNFENRASGRFKVLMDRTYNMDRDTKDHYFFNWYFKMHAKARWNTSAGTDVDHYEGQVYVAFLTDQITGNAPTVDANARLRYLDN